MVLRAIGPWLWYYVAKFDEAASKIVLQVTQIVSFLLERGLRFCTLIRIFSNSERVKGPHATSHRDEPTVTSKRRFLDFELRSMRREDLPAGTR
jgi:hypothetical protein